MTDTKKLESKLKELVEANWKKKSSPFLLSDLGLALLSEGIEYKTILAGGSISRFIDNLSGVQIVKHPKQFAKIGVIPENEIFDFSSDPEIVNTNQVDKSRELRRRRFAYYDFIRLLKELDLSDEELNSVQIPTSVVVKILEK